jgi:gas vesicle protein
MNAKTTAALSAFLGGIALGALAGLLFAPEKGSDTRARIVEELKERGLFVTKEQLEALVEKIKARVGCTFGDEEKCIKEAIDELA